jgi:hypothetical protein
MVAPLRRLYSWGIPSYEIVTLLRAFVRNYGELVELGAGTGCWAFNLAGDGVSVNPYDLTPCHHYELNGHQLSTTFHAQQTLPLSLMPSKVILFR